MTREWMVGDHTVIAGDCRDYKLPDGERPALILLDPPYGVNVGGVTEAKINSSKKRMETTYIVSMLDGGPSLVERKSRNHPGIGMYADGTPRISPIHGDGARFYDDDEGYPGVQEILQTTVDKKGTAIACFASWKSLPDAYTAVSSWGIKTLGVWMKGASKYNFTTAYSTTSMEFIVFAGKIRCNSSSKTPVFNHFRKNWYSRLKPLPIKERDELRPKLLINPTLKPVELYAELIEDLTQPGDLVLDPYAGSLTTLLACQQTGRRAVCIELEEGFIEFGLLCMKKQYGIEAIEVEDDIFEPEEAS